MGEQDAPRVAQPLVKGDPALGSVARTMLEGRAADSVTAVAKIVGSDFRDPEGLFYLSRHLARLNEVSPALELLERVVASGYSCFPTMARDPWLNSLRKKLAFSKLLRGTEMQHREALAAFEGAGGAKVFVAPTPSADAGRSAASRPSPPIGT